MIFEEIIEGIEKKVKPSLPTKGKRDEREWIRLGVEFEKLKVAKGVTAKQFADSKGINYSSFTKSMSRYRNNIQYALKVDNIKKKPVGKMTKNEKSLMLINNFRKSLKDRAASPNAKINNKSEEWFRNTIAAGVKGHVVAKPETGKLYAFVYDAKYKDKLPYWDRYPLIIMLGSGKSKAGNDVFLGLNLHYIPPKARQEFLEQLLKRHASSDGRFSNSTKLKINWSDVRGMKGSDLMIKMYLPSHVKKTFVEIAPKDWVNVIYMPTHQFVSKGKRFSANKVWSNY